MLSLPGEEGFWEWTCGKRPREIEFFLGAQSCVLASLIILTVTHGYDLQNTCFTGGSLRLASLSTVIHSVALPGSQAPCPWTPLRFLKVWKPALEGSPGYSGEC
jgi:hypothetical protein